MKLSVPFIEKIWRAEGEVPLDEALTPAEAFARLDPLFQTPGTTYAIEGDTLTYAKHNPAAQDKLATFTHGTLRLVQPADGTARLTFAASSKALLLCFLAPLLFLAFAQIMTVANNWEKAAMAAEKAAGKSEDKSKDKDKAVPQLHPIDQMLGAPAPEDPSKKKDGKKDEPKEKFRTTPAYVLAGLFFVVFLVGRVLEPWLLKRTLRTALAARTSESDGTPDTAGLCSGTS
jgi:hypothetical protein